MNHLDQLAELFKEFPGVGPRQAKRFVYFLLMKNKGYTDELARIIPQIKSNVRTCTSCFRYFINDKSDHPLCSICSNTHRDTGVLMIVGRDTDLESFEKSGTYHGSYFVLGGLLPILEEDAQKFIRLAELKKHIESNSYTEIILALSANPDGDHTADFVAHELQKIVSPETKITHLGRGLSTGSELEYADKETLRHALENRVTQQM